MTDKQITVAIGAITYAELVMDFPDVVLDALNSVVKFLATMDGQSEHTKGKWIKEDRGHVEYDAVCSECGFNLMWSERRYFKFCPNCGAEMKDEQDNDK